MFWQCCRRSNQGHPVKNGEDSSKKTNKNGIGESYAMDIRISTISNESQKSQDSNRNGSVPIPPSTNERRIRTNSSSSVKSGESFYSVKSSATSAGADGDFYSVCSVDSFKST